MRRRIYYVLAIILIVLGIISNIFGMVYSFLILGVIMTVHGIVVLKSESYKIFLVSIFGVSIEGKFKDKEEFYKSQGVKIEGNTYFNTEMIIGGFIFIQGLLNGNDLAFNPSLINTIIGIIVIEVLALIFDFSLCHIARKSESYSEYYWKSLIAFSFVLKV